MLASSFSEFDPKQTLAGGYRMCGADVNPWANRRTYKLRAIRSLLGRLPRASAKAFPVSHWGAGMTPLRTAVIMKTDICGSTPRFRDLLTADLQALLSEHRNFLARCAAEQDGLIIKATGDGYWLEFISVTAAARAAVEIQEALRLAQPNRGDDRLSIRIIIAVGDIAVQDGDFIGDAFALATRVEAVTPPDEIYLTAAARLALTSAAEIQTAFVEMFTFKGYAEPMPVYRIQQRHRTRIVADTYILFLDLKGFGKIMDADPASTAIERILDKLDAVTHGVAQEFAGTIRFNQSDSYCVTFAEAGEAVAAAERLSRNWDATEQFGCAINMGLHRGTVYTFRSFLYGRDVWIASQLQNASGKLLSPGENGIFVSAAIRDALFGTMLHNRFAPVTLPAGLLADIEVFRLNE